ncbi:unnamed protein product, partial [Aphanomyces euteiches]
MDVIVKMETLTSDAERRLAKLWSQVLNVDTNKIGRTTSFFALGGDSISAIRLVAKAKQVGLRLTSSLVMKHSTLESMLRVAKEVLPEADATKPEDIHG